MDRMCSMCSGYFRTKYKGKTPKCPSCVAYEKKRQKACDLVAGALKRWRERKITSLFVVAESGDDVSTIARLLKQPLYSRLLVAATPEMMREFPTRYELTSFRYYMPGSLLSMLCARHNPTMPIPPTFPKLLRILLAASPRAVSPSSTMWMHPINFLCRGDPLYKECRRVLLDDMYWGPVIHAVLPDIDRMRYVLLARILRKHDVHGDGEIFKLISLFLPPVFKNNSAEFHYCTVREMADDLGIAITEELWTEVTLNVMSTLMSQAMDTYVSPTALRMLEYNSPDFYELDGVVGVPEIRSSGRVCKSLAFSKNLQVGISKAIRERRVHVEGPVSSAMLGVRHPCSVAMTKTQFTELKTAVETANMDQTANIDGIYSSWLTIRDDTAVEEAERGRQYDDVADPDWW